MNATQHHYFATTEDSFTNEHKAELHEFNDAMARALDLSSNRPREFRSVFPPRLYERLAELGWELNVQIALMEPNSHGSGKIKRRRLSAVKNGVGIDHSFGHYSATLYEIYGLLPHFARAGLVRAGIIIVPTNDLAKKLPRGTSPFDQITVDLDARGPSNLDVPTVIVAVGPTGP